MNSLGLEGILTSVQLIHNNEEGHLLGNGGDTIVEAHTEEDISSVLAYANEHDKTVTIVSGGTKRGYGGLMEQADILLSLASFKGIVEHSVGDLTMTVRPGTTLQEITDELHKHGQRIALDTPWPEMATIGGIVSANDSGAKRLLYGSARDLVIGMRIGYPDGRVIRTGGKVVKNVAGYDMNKLFIGAMGTLGVISEITIKLRPLPKYEGLSLLHFPKGSKPDIRAFSVQLLDSMMEPVSLEMLNAKLAEKLTGERNNTLVIAFEDRKKAVLEQEKWISKHLPTGVKHTVLHEGKASEWWDKFRHLGPNGYNDSEIDADTLAALKIGSNNLDVLISLEAADQLAEAHHVVVEAHGGLGHGISKVYVKGFPEDIVSYIKALRAKVEEKRGVVICTHLPFKLRKAVSVWGKKPSYFSLLEGIKQTNDPKKILNRQRFVGGI
ncbi:glycolate oxidase [Lentibacillus populi]|uniref:Glycolate oxidase n=1 Tax=Lentibacillus populi TaxID=1827502 RepID=A0A9W5U0U3_9BACI|nr:MULTISPECIES: FAD-binding oxidoreductase [Bacillaceae]MBT2216276.1 FAD-binding oxidoreductase [Virgibacillus dakarensis]GGB57555.1 glycolate oxidase [Lentibacillus populi]